MTRYSPSRIKIKRILYNPLRIKVVMFASILAGCFGSFASFFSKLAVNEPVFVILVLLSNLLMWGCFLASLQTSSTLKSQVLNSSFNLLTTLLLGYLTGEQISPKKIIGGAIIITGSIILNQKEGQKEKID